MTTIETNKTICIALKNREDGYSVVSDFVRRYWSVAKTNSPAIVSFEISYDGIEYEYLKEVAYLTGYDDVEFFYDWWEGQKYIKLLGIKSIDNIEILGGIYTG